MHVRIEGLEGMCVQEVAGKGTEGKGTCMNSVMDCILGRQWQ